MNATILIVDGTNYELEPRVKRTEYALNFDIHIRHAGRRVAMFRLRCASWEPQHASLDRLSIEELREMASAHDLQRLSRTALHWQSALRKINPNSSISPVLHPWFAENYRTEARL